MKKTTVLIHLDIISSDIGTDPIRIEDSSTVQAIVDDVKSGKKLKEKIEGWIYKYVNNRPPSGVISGDLRFMKNITALVDGKWQKAKQVPYYNSGINWLKCLLGFHEHYVSRKYIGTLTCFRCGKRKTGLNHY